VTDVPVEPLAGKVVLDTNNYYPGRDGQIPALDAGEVTSSQLLQQHLPTSRVVKAFNHIGSADLESQGQPSGSDGRRALSVFGDDADAVALASQWLDRLGYDVVNGGGLEESWRIQPDTPGYGPRLDADGLRQALADAQRP
jgi:8-hydroxy-5-deazaflavin:NADPH oxidoreductase